MDNLNELVILINKGWVEILIELNYCFKIFGSLFLFW